MIIDIRNDSSPDSKFRNLLDAIPSGEAHAIHARDIAFALGFSDTRIIRAMISSARTAGNIIASSDSGYFVPETLEELRHFVSAGQSRINSGFACVAHARKLLKQLQEEDALED